MVSACQNDKHHVTSRIANGVHDAAVATSEANKKYHVTGARRSIQTCPYRATRTRPRDSRHPTRATRHTSHGSTSHEPSAPYRDGRCSGFGRVPKCEGLRGGAPRRLSYFSGGVGGSFKGQAIQRRAPSHAEGWCRSGERVGEGPAGEPGAQGGGENRRRCGWLLGEAPGCTQRAGKRGRRSALGV